MRWHEQARGGNLSATSPSPASSDSVMGTKDAAKTKLARGKSSQGKKGQGGKGLLSRKAVKKAAESSVDPPPSEKPSPAESQQSIVKEKDGSEDQNHARSNLVFPTSSIIPDPLAELPSWFNTDTEASATQFSSRYPMHNTAGPRWYRNHHLLPPQHDNLPPTQFSTSFPPMKSAAERSQESTRVPGLSRTPSASPSPTPNSSQLGINRVRKISQTAHDEVDLLDASDPWGTNWHHESPYDIGLNAERNASPDAELQGSSDPRSRRLSLTTSGSRHKSVIPSPLSQSTSAVHLHIPDSGDSHLPRKLSKRRKPFIGLFGGQSQDGYQPQKSVSAPPNATQLLGGDILLQRKVSRRRSTAGPPISPSASSETEQKEKHGGFMGRFARRFSVMRKTDASKATNVASNDWNHNGGVNGNTRQSPTGSQTSESASGALVNDARRSDSSKRVPPPTAEGESQALTDGTLSNEQQRPSTSLSIERPIAMAKLTIANPDELNGSVDISPSERERSLPTVIVPGPSKIETVAPIDEPHERMLDVPVSASPTRMNSTLPLPTRSALSTATVAEPMDIPKSAPSLPLPDLPPPSTVGDNDSSLPPTPKSSRLSFPSTEQPTIVSPGQSYIQDALSYTVSASGLTAPATSVASADESPLSRASVLANPPTPFASPIIPPRVSIIPARARSSSENAKPLESSIKTKDGSHHAKSSSVTKRRETETFRLVRSPSGGMYPTGDVITGMGEQWEVVESPTESPKKSRRKERSKSKEPDSGIGLQERRVEQSSSAEDGDGHHRRQRSINSRHATEISSQSVRSTRTPSIDHRRPGGHDGAFSSHKDNRSRSRQRNETETEASRIAKSSSAAVHGSQPSQQSSLQPASHIHSNGSIHRRRASESARPTSDFQSIAELNAVKAKDAWEMERLWKARSMAYGPDGAAIVSTPPTIGDNSRPSTLVSTDMHGAGTIPSVTDLYRATSLPVSSPGSSHTYFVVQSPFQNTHNPPHIQIPVTPPPIYASTSQPQRSGETSSPPRRRKAARSFSASVPFPSTNYNPDPPSLTRTFLANPLPDPPRLSPYQASPLPPSLVGTGDGSSDYWAQYAGVPTRY
ncbi:hypothetical protein AcV5_004783 [Taiwanofungus camphoratus]|nr:hypothetical protein AcW2_000618 [Antrodia cinnamomea]KAI0936713.1 hypothetical protein AcV5_004783 [Antrodia cinnamomea]